MVECAIVVGLVTLAAIAAVLFVGGNSRQTFSSLAAWTNFERATPRDLDRGRNVEIVAPIVELASNSDSPLNTVQIDVRALACLFAGLVLVGFVVARRKRINARRGLEQLTADRALLDHLDEKRFIKRQEILKLLSNDPSALFENRVAVSQLMTTQLRTVQATTSVAEMQELVRRDHLRHFPVVDGKGTLVGIVSDRDLLGQNGRRAIDVMTRSMVTVNPTTKVSPATTLMINRNISCLPVVQGTQLVGLLTTTDLVMTLQSALQLLQRAAHEVHESAEDCTDDLATIGNWRST